MYSINSVKGKGIHSKSNIYLGEENGDDENLEIDIYSENEGIEAKVKEVNSTIINIETKEDGINVANDTCSRDCCGNCDCYMKFKGGEIKIISTEDGIDSNGDIFITGEK